MGGVEEIIFGIMKCIKLKIRKAPKGFQNPFGASVLAPSRYVFAYVTPQDHTYRDIAKKPC
jgi:hypothetical protein